MMMEQAVSSSAQGWCCKRLYLSIPSPAKKGDRQNMSAQHTTTEPQSQQSTLGEVSHVPAGTSRVSCDGGGGALGHPQIWLTLSVGQGGVAQATCPYCSRQFISS